MLTPAPTEAPVVGGRVAVTAMFAITAVLCGIFTARFSALVDRFGISPADLSAVLFLWALSAVLATLVIRRAITRFGSAVVLRFAAPTCALTLAAVAAAPNFWALIAATTAFGAAFGILEIAVNSQGAALERIHRRPLLGGMHAAWGIGAVAGGALAAVFGHLGTGYGWSVGSVALCALPATVLLGRSLPEPGPVGSAGSAARPTGRRRRPTPAVCLLSAAAFGAFVVESSVADWSGILLRHELGTSHAIAAIGYPLFQCGLLSGRLITDRIRAAHGSRRVLASGGLATAATFAVVATVSSPVVALLALYAVGAAIGPVLPTAFSAAGTLDQRADGSAIAQVGAAGYTGMLIGPAAVGTFTTVVTLRSGLGAVVVVFGVVIAAAAAMLPQPAAALSAALTHPSAADRVLASLAIVTLCIPVLGGGVVGSNAEPWLRNTVCPRYGRGLARSRSSTGKALVGRRGLIVLQVGEGDDHAVGDAVGDVRGPWEGRATVRWWSSPCTPGTDQGRGCLTGKPVRIRISSLSARART